MSTICEPEPYESCTITVQRSSPGSYTVYEAHRHRGARAHCPLQDQYTNLMWDEACELAATLLDARRPGMHPAGWEQLGLEL